MRIIILLFITCSFISSLFVICGLSDKAEAAFYTFYDLGSNASASWINNSGDVVGIANSYAFYKVFGQPMQNLGGLGGGMSYASQINNLGQVVGWAFTSQLFNPEHAFLWTSSTGMQDLGTLGYLYSDAWGINDQGQIVGDSYPSLYSGYHAFLKNPGQAMQDLGTLGGFTGSACKINNSGQIVGTAETAAGYDHAFLMNPGQPMQDLSPSGTYLSYGYGINDSGQVVGRIQFFGTAGARGFLKNPGQDMQILPTLGGNWGEAYSINNLGQVVGSAGPDININYHAVLWENGSIYDLNSLTVNLPNGTVLKDAGDINDNGWIVGDTSDNHAFLLIPGGEAPPSPSVPIPSTLFLLGSGVLGLNLFRFLNKA